MIVIVSCGLYNFGGEGVRSFYVVFEFYILYFCGFLIKLLMWNFVVFMFFVFLEIFI